MQEINGEGLQNDVALEDGKVIPQDEGACDRQLILTPNYHCLSKVGLTSEQRRYA